MGGSGQIWVFRSSYGQKRSKTQKTLKNESILRQFWHFLLRTDENTEILLNLKQSFENPRRRSSNLVCSCSWKSEHLLIRCGIYCVVWLRLKQRIASSLNYARCRGDFSLISFLPQNSFCKVSTPKFTVYENQIWIHISYYCLNLNLPLN